MELTAYNQDPSQGYTVVIGLLEVDLLLPDCRSLKAKRGVVARTTNHLRKKFSLSVAEVAMQDTWGRAGLAAVTVSGSRTVAERSLKSAVAALEKDRDVQLLDYSLQFF